MCLQRSPHVSVDPYAGARRLFSLTVAFFFHNPLNGLNHIL